MKFLIVSPQPTYVDYIGGITVAHTLANAISKEGQDVYLYADSTNPKYNLTCIPHNSVFDFDENNTIVILIAGAGEHTYLPNIPEYIVNAKNVVRWLVNDQVKLYPEKNKFYKFHKYWHTIEQQRIDGYLSVIEVDRNIFLNKHQPRKGTCFLIKGNLDEETDRFINTQNDFCIDQYLYNIPNFHRMQFLSDVFNSHELFISYTPHTFASILAALCGCISVVLPKSNFDKNKWMSEIYFTKYGVAVGMDDISRAKETLHLVPNLIDTYCSEIQPNQVKKFIKDCYEWIG